MAHREAVKEYLSKISLKDCQVIDWGAGSKPVKKYIKHDGVKFFTIDKNELTNPNLLTDIEKPVNLPPYVEPEYAFCMEVLEHTWNDRQLLANIWGHCHTLYLSVPFSLNIHADDDYRRYTRHGLSRLLDQNGFLVQEMQITGGTEDLPYGYIVKAVIYA